MNAKKSRVYSNVTFQEWENSQSKYAIVDEFPVADEIQDLINGIGDNPEGIVSIVGGNDGVFMPEKAREIFLGGFAKSFTEADVWFVTGGTNTSFMRQIGVALTSQAWRQKPLVLIGVADLNSLYEKEVFNQKDCTWPTNTSPAVFRNVGRSLTMLDPSHSHFILVNTVDSKKEDIVFKIRARLETAIAERTKAIFAFPLSLLMVINGDGEIFSHIRRALATKTAVILMKGFGGLTDILVSALQNSELLDPSAIEQVSRKVQMLGLTIEQSYLEEQLKYLIKKKKHLNIFDFDKFNSKVEFSVAVASVIYRNKTHENYHSSQGLRRVLEYWNYDTLKVLLDDNDIDKSNIDFYEWTFKAIRKRQWKFVKLFVDHGVNLQHFTQRDLVDLYQPVDDGVIDSKSGYNNYQEMKDLLVPSVALGLKKAGYAMPNCLEDIFKNTVESKIKNSGASVKVASRVMERSPSIPLETLPRENNDKLLDTRIRVEDLFVWSLLLMDQNLAKVFWSESEEPLMSALFVKKVNKIIIKTRKIEHPFQLEKVNRNTDEFTNLAGEMMDSSLCKDDMPRLLVKKLKYWKDKSCFLMAAESKNTRIMSNSVYQMKLENIWRGADKRNEDQSNDTCCGRLKNFLFIPMVSFYLNLFFYLIFLTLYSFNMLVAYDPAISLVEIIVIIWAFTMLCEEFREFFECRHNVYTDPSDYKIKKVILMLKAYFNSFKNTIEFLMLMLFVAGCILRSIPTNICIPCFDISRVLLSVALFFFFIGLLNTFVVSKVLGPKLSMIYEMIIKDLIPFIRILLVFMMAYAIATEAILYPKSELSWSLLYHLPRKAYWQIYGELFLEDIEGESVCTADKTQYTDYQKLRCPTEEGKYLAPIFLGMYILLTNVLLLNLLIAMFSYTFQNIQQNAYYNWCLQRYHLVKQYSTRPSLPPPFIIIIHMYRLFRFCCTRHHYDIFVEDDDDLTLAHKERILAKQCLYGKDKGTGDEVEDKYTAIMKRMKETQSSFEKQINAGITHVSETPMNSAATGVINDQRIVKIENQIEELLEATRKVLELQQTTQL